MIDQYLFMLVIVLLGLTTTFLFKDNFKKFFRYVLAFPLGLILWGLFILIFITAGIPIDRFIIISLSILFILVLFFFGLKQKRYSKRDINEISIFILIFSSLSFIFLILNFSFLTNDSWQLITGGNLVTSSAGIPNKYVSIYGVLQYIFMSSGKIFGFDYLYVLSPLMMMSIALILFESFFSSLKNKNVHFNERIGYSLMILLIPLSGFLILIGWVYVSSNISTAFFSFLGFFGIWKRLETGEKFWTVFSALMVLSVGLLRVEGSLFILINILIFNSLSEVQYKEKLAYSYAVLGPMFIWIVKLVVRLMNYNYPLGNDFITSDNLLIILAIYLLFLLYVSFFQRKLPQKLVQNTPLLMLYVLTIGWTYILFTIGMQQKGYMLIINRYGFFLINILKNGYWGLTWLALGILFIFALFLKRIKYESVFLNYIVSFALLYNIINVFRNGWRMGWGDTGNRTLFHVLFIVCLYVGLKFLNIFFSKRDAT